MNVTRSFMAQVALVLAAGLALPAAVAGAQAPAPGCASETVLQDACQTAADLLTFVAPQVGAVLAGGSATLGQGGISGGFGHVSFALRANGMGAELPDLAAAPPGPGGASARTIPVQGHFVLMPQLDLSIGVTRGMPFGGTNVGGLDLLVSGSWIPDVDSDVVQVDAPGSGFRVGYGARLVLAQETFATPSLSLTYMRRDTPHMRVVAPGAGRRDTVSVSRLRLSTDSWRLMGSKSFYDFGFAAGIGQDRVHAAGDLSAVLREGGVEARTAAPIAHQHDMTRTNAFVDVTVAVRSSRLVLEVGSVWGGDAPTYSGFQGTSADAARVYGSIGLRMGF
ncbi:MAG TPA: hypothetical protein VGE02_14445 [Gemmatimonadales bacterium]